ncbi:hypothetical protein WICPIJ_004568 [Wickerhamomyces pijperi]|uniref:Uncharacterized protein n=1 Tax=Wickerhamomyces pijperi TaxID=599730 RepID=A0A9P8Q7T2_WICPI|nr:hypothetical protein WICPIJ_004568 [Wickerhamomyces pijperi]
MDPTFQVQRVQRAIQADQRREEIGDQKNRMTCSDPALSKQEVLEMGVPGDVHVRRRDKRLQREVQAGEFDQLDQRMQQHGGVLVHVQVVVEDPDKDQKHHRLVDPHRNGLVVLERLLQLEVFVDSEPCDVE